jgi:hypothetical protein
VVVWTWCDGPGKVHVEGYARDSNLTSAQLARAELLVRSLVELYGEVAATVLRELGTRRWQRGCRREWSDE